MFRFLFIALFIALTAGFSITPRAGTIRMEEGAKKKVNAPQHGRIREIRQSTALFIGCWKTAAAKEASSAAASWKNNGGMKTDTFNNNAFWKK